MDTSIALLAVVVATALVFDFTNGFHDTANAMATTIATRALPPRVAVGWAALLNFVGAFLSIKVAATIAEGIVDQGAVTLQIIFAGLTGALLWNVATWYLGIPSSSSHALIGGVIGAVIAAAGSGAVLWKGVISDVVAPGLLAPLLAMAVAALGTYLAFRLTRRVREDTSSRTFRLGQLGSSSLVALAHGTNDAQKTMGVIVLALVAAGRLDKGAGVPLWVQASAAGAIAIGTFSGGWRVIRTLGSRVTKITSSQGFAAETSSAAVILASSYYGFPLSTTHVVSGGVTGAGIARDVSAVRWSTVGRMFGAWVLTLPAAGLVGAAAYGASRIGSSATVGVYVVGAVALLLLAGALYLASRDHVGAHNAVDEIETPSAAPRSPERVKVPA